MGSIQNSRPVRIQNISGSPVDRRDALFRAVSSSEPIDVFVGDWMSELNMPSRAYSIMTEGDKAIGYEPSYLQALEPALKKLAERRIKFVANGGCVGTKDLYEQVLKMIKEKGLEGQLNVAWVEGDIVTDVIKAADPTTQISVCTGQKLSEWPHTPLFAQCYLGGWAIAKALEAGADIVICGRVADASPIIGAATWWHNWQRTDFNYLAQTLIAGHLIECSNYVTGGNFSGYTNMDWTKIHDLGYPIAEIAHDADIIITKPPGSGGLVSIETCKEQLLYEIQGKYYYNSDVTAVIDNVKFEQVEEDRVRLSGVTGLAPPPTTKAGVTADGGYMVSANWAVVGLDIDKKKALFELQLKHMLGKELLSKLSHIDVQVYGSVEENPRNQNAATVDMRLVLQAREKSTLSLETLFGPVFSFLMQSFPAATFTNVDINPKPFQEYFPTLIPQPSPIVHFSDTSIPDLNVPAPTDVLTEKLVQPSYETVSPIDINSFGPTIKMPLGRILYARAGDKGSNCNLGLFPMNEAVWPWLRSFLSTKKFIELIGPDDYKGQKIERMEFPNICAVHFLLHDWLDRGVVANATYDILGKFIAEYIRAKVIDVPIKFLQYGML